jgi:hypothetical protein
MDTKTKKRPKSAPDQGRLPRRGGSAADARVFILGLIGDFGVSNFTKGLAGAIKDIDVFAPEGGAGVAKLNGLKRIFELIDESGAAHVASALEESVRIHGTVEAASTAIGRYTDHIMQEAEDYAEHPTEEASIHLSDAVWRGQPPQVLRRRQTRVEERRDGE